MSGNDEPSDMTDEDDFYDDDQFPWKDAEAAQKACPQCNTAAGELSWFYFDSPTETWENLCGRAGRTTVCDCRHLQVDFFARC